MSVRSSFIFFSCLWRTVDFTVTASISFITFFIHLFVYVFIIWLNSRCTSNLIQEFAKGLLTVLRLYLFKVFNDILGLVILPNILSKYYVMLSKASPDIGTGLTCYKCECKIVNYAFLFCGLSSPSYSECTYQMLMFRTISVEIDLLSFLLHMNSWNTSFENMSLGWWYPNETFLVLLIYS